ncbi:DUF4974 domain-containing protein [Chitinophaga horti]|uniref:DUF4974 domain-containing protein n=1 Tax=Chitinophaga horti TaxID=2920382 RepID=A0ABY6J483_9BACT|nr:FecR family protein [Chitinophaga horti]UYQ94186.1 DUF4974 domain-containing protein [Chitinophaga horti]
MIKPESEDIIHFFRMLERYTAGTASPAETEFVERYMQLLEYRSPAPPDFASTKDDIGKEIKNQLFDAIAQDTVRPAIHRVHFLRRYWWAAAAAVVLLAGGGYALLRQQPVPQTQVAAVVDVQPGKSGAILTLANGEQVLLDSLGNGQVAVQSGATVHIQNGALLYDQHGGDGAVAFNTVSTPKGRQFRVILPDGTKVWLNAASSLTYPTHFDGRERQVTVAGEAYFEVAQIAQQPFKVKVNDRTEVLVLGTSFNINAYYNEAGIYTTLLSGAVKVTNDAAGKVLRPGEQAGILAGSRDIAVAPVNTAEVVAWKNGSFAFANADIQTVMRQLERWYDIEVRYEGAIPEGTFSGEIDRSLTLTQVLNGLAKTRIRYRLEGEHQLIIQP